MGIKEQIVAVIQNEGFDLMTACELADQAISETKASHKDFITWNIGKTQFTLGVSNENSQTTENLAQTVPALSTLQPLRPEPPESAWRPVPGSKRYPRQ